VSEDVPILFARPLFFFFLVSTSSASGVGGGGASGAGRFITDGDGIFGLAKHIIYYSLVKMFSDCSTFLARK
tara:strand:- start:1708 stop:1923 length:216 start_codon:yes stop_codon:yes gene_type:complete